MYAYLEKGSQLEQMERLQKQLTQELMLLDQQDRISSKGRIKTQPSVFPSYNTSRNVVSKKPLNMTKNLKVNGSVQQVRPPRQQYADRMNNKENKQNNACIAKPIKNQVKQRVVAAKPSSHNSVPNKNYFQSAKNYPEGRVLLHEYEPQHLFEEHQHPEDDQMLLDNDSLQLDSDSLNFEVKDVDEIEEQSYDKIYNNQSVFNSLKENGRRIKQSKQQNSQEMGCTFKPLILEKSKKIAEKLQPSFDRLTAKGKRKNATGYRQPDQMNRKYSRDRINTLSQPRQPQTSERRQEEQYPFRPILSKKSLKQFQYTDMDIIARNELWLQQKEMKILKLRQEQEKLKTMKELEAQNKIIGSSNANMRIPKEANLSKFMKDGLAGYFERLQHASEIKKRTEQAELRFSGKGWNGGITKPKEFKLSGADKTKSPKTVPKVMQKQYQRVVKELHQKIQKLHI